MAVGCIIIQEVKELMKKFTVQEEDQFLCKISGSLFTSFTCSYMVVACITMSGLSVKLELKHVTMHYPGRKPVYLPIFELIIQVN